MWRAEIFNVVYKGQIELKANQHIGTIKVNDGVHDHFLYNVSKAEKGKASLKRLDEVVLGGPSIGSIAANGSLTFGIDLFSGVFKDCFTLSNCSSNTSISASWPYEQRIVSEDGRGEICILYAIYNNAVEAHIVVTFFTDDRYDPEVYGVIAASTSEIETTEFSSMLFIKKKSEKIKIACGKPFPLSRSIVAVPLDCEFFVDLHLKCGDKKFVKRTFTFQPKKDGSSKDPPVKEARFRYQVEVFWKCA